MTDLLRLLLCRAGLHQWRPTRAHNVQRCRCCGRHHFRSLP